MFKHAHAASVVYFHWPLLLAAALGFACAAGTDDPGRGNGGTGGGAGHVTGTGGSASGSGGANGSGGDISGSGGSSTGTGGDVSGSGGSTGTGGDVSGSGGSTGTGGDVAGSGGSGTGGSTGTGGGNSTDMTCGAGVTPVGIGRCATGLVVAKGTALTIHNFEEPGEMNDYEGVFFADGRSGKWFAGDSNNNSGIKKVETVVGPTGKNTHALHYHGSAPGSWAALGIPVANCYDASAYHGISFDIKGNPGAGNDTVKFNVHTPVSEPVANGGGCSDADDAAEKCHDHFAKMIPVTSQWVHQTMKWSDLKQNCPSNLPGGFNVAKQIVTFSFSIPKATAGYDIWIDNFSFDTGDLTSNGLADIVSNATFDEMWTTIAPGSTTVTNLRNAFYKYADMTSAVGSFPAFSKTGDARIRRLEVAAFFSNVAHETDSLGIIEEKGCSPNKCPQYGGSAPNGQTYHGRGPIQLTWQANYKSAGTGIGLGNQLSDNPGKVSSDASIAWKTGFWFWMSGGTGTSPHGAITGNQGFGETIRIINGALECGGANAAAVQDRIKHFKRFCYMFGIDPGDDNLGC
jgi:predicted chitinase